MQITSAKRVPWSSVVGQSVTLHDESGAVVGQIAVIGTGSREASEAIAEQIVELFDSLSRHKSVVENLHVLSTSNKR